jgi:hypothetical protein
MVAAGALKNAVNRLVGYHVIVRIFAVLLLAAVSLRAAEADAAAILETLRNRHLPYGMALDPVFESAESSAVVSYSRCGDSAIWTGHLLAAESFRYAVTRSADALEGVRNALDGIRKLVDATGRNSLARCAFPADSPYAADMISEEREHGHYPGMIDGRPWTWIGNTSRDQYLGVFFGLTVAWNHVDDASVRGGVSSLVTRMLNRLLDDGWLVWSPHLSTSFSARLDQQLTLLKLGRRVNGSRFSNRYRLSSIFGSPGVILPITFEVTEAHESYFKFNLDHIAFYGLLTGGDSSFVEWNYRNAFELLRKTTDDHGNAFFDLIERAVNGPEAARDERIRSNLAAWLTRGRRDHYVDRRDRYEVCGENRACSELAIADRVPTDFLWQRSPFQIYGGGTGRIEGAGIDYLLPYWMGRYFGVVP